MKSDSVKSEEFFQPSVILERPALWSRLFVWLLVSATTSAIAWTAIAKIDETVVATGKLEPVGAVKEVNAPTGGVIREILVKDGEVVKQGQPLIEFDPTAPKADLESLRKIRSSLILENQFYNLALEGKKPITGSSDLMSLLKLRADLAQENRYYQALVKGLNPKVSGTTEFDANQSRLLAASRAEVQSKVAAARFQIQEYEKQRSQAQQELATAKQVLAVNQNILRKIKPLATGEGAISQLQFERQNQEVFTREGEVKRLIDEVKRLEISIAHAQEDLQNTIAVSARDILSKIAENQKKISEIDTELSKSRLENKKRLTEIEAQLSKAVQSLQYQQIKSPVNGIVFDVQPRSAGFVIGETQAIMKIVPNDKLVARIFLTNKDIGFVREGMTVDVRVDSFPSTEFGSIKGKLIRLGSDALPPTQERQFYAFPAEIELDSQTLAVNGKPVALQSGMSVNSSIIVRKRSILSIMTDLFDKQVKNIESIR